MMNSKLFINNLITWNSEVKCSIKNFETKRHVFKYEGKI